jgi:hypothetical protein
MNLLRGGIRMKKKGAKKRYIFRPYITINGKRIYAATYGHKAFKNTSSLVT